MKTSHFRLLIGLAIVGIFAYITCVYSIPPLYREYTHADQFAPVLTGRVTEALSARLTFTVVTSLGLMIFGWLGISGLVRGFRA